MIEETTLTSQEKANSVIKLSFTFYRRLPKHQHQQQQQCQHVLPWHLQQQESHQSSLNNMSQLVVRFFESNACFPKDICFPKMLRFLYICVVQRNFEICKEN